MKVLLVNGSPHKAGCTHTALQLVGGALLEEGVQVMQVLGRNMAWLLKSIEAGRAAGLESPTPIKHRVGTNFIR